MCSNLSRVQKSISISFQFSIFLWLFRITTIFFIDFFKSNVFFLVLFRRFSFKILQIYHIRFRVIILKHYHIKLLQFLSKSLKNHLIFLSMIFRVTNFFDFHMFLIRDFFKTLSNHIDFFFLLFSNFFKSWSSRFSFDCSQYLSDVSNESMRALDFSLKSTCYENEKRFEKYDRMRLNA